MRNLFWGVMLAALSSLNYAQVTSTTPVPTATQPQQGSITEKPRVFITDSQSWEIMGSAGGANGAFAAETHGGARPQTAEIIKTFGQRCPDVIVNNKQELADYIVLLDHEGGKGLLRRKDKVAVFEHTSGDVVVSHSTLSVGGSVEDACRGIMHDWTIHGAALVAAKTQPVTTTVAPSVSTQSSASQSTGHIAAVAVDSTPSGADIEVDGGFVGSTPSTINLATGSHEITIKKKGFADWSRKLNVTGGNIHLSAELEAAPAQ